MVIALYQHRALGDRPAFPLSGPILLFSVSHDNERVEIYGQTLRCHGGSQGPHTINAERWGEAEHGFGGE